MSAGPAIELLEKASGPFFTDPINVRPISVAEVDRYSCIQLLAYQGSVIDCTDDIQDLALINVL